MGRSDGTVYASANRGATFAVLSDKLPKGEGDLRAELGRAGVVWLAGTDGVLRD